MEPTVEVRCALVAEDDRSIRNGLALTLGRLKINFDTAEDGAEAIRLMSHRRYKVLVLDLIMPKATGLEVIRQMANNRLPYRAPVIVITGADTSLLRDVDRSVVKRVFVKPVNFEAVAAEIRGICAQDS